MGTSTFNSRSLFEKNLFIVGTLIGAMLLFSSHPMQAQDATIEKFTKYFDHAMKDEASFIKVYAPIATENASVYGWMLFLYANRQDPGSAARRWETWPTDPETFTTLKTPQTFAAVVSSNRAKELKTPALIEHGSVGGPSSSTPASYAAAIKTIKEEVRRNRYVYDYITGQCSPKSKVTCTTNTIPIHTRDGLNNYIKKSGYKALDFPIESLEVKAAWKPVSKSQEADYYTAQYDGQTYGLVGLHIMSKVLKTWFWVTYEHKDNPLFGKQFRPGGEASNDSFGYPKNKKDGKYSNTPSPRLRVLLESNGLTEPYWQNYRQASWQNAVNNPEISSNSTMEANIYTNTGSCITCHGAASYDTKKKGSPASYFGRIDQTLTQNDSFEEVILWAQTKPTDLELTFPKQGFTGSTDPQYNRKLSLDFIWGFLKAKQSVAAD